MTRLSDLLKNYEGANPFIDNQPRSFSDSKICNEFYPVSEFWSLFNDQNEILIGSRGSGKTYLLKMMRYSMLKRINDERAQKLVLEKKYISLYVPMHLEYVIPFNYKNEVDSISIFQFSFNCLLAKALLIELESLLEDLDVESRLKKQIALVSNLEQLWFSKKTGIYEIKDLRQKIDGLFFSSEDSKNYSRNFFSRQICTPLISAKDVINDVFEFEECPTWIVCVDEAEFLNESIQKCLNSFFRSDSNGIALKIATLPYCHTTLQTQIQTISVSDGNDFSYRFIDMKYDNPDFISLTNKLCANRLNRRILHEDKCQTLEDFIGVVGHDDYIDYFKLEMKNTRVDRESIENAIIESFSEKRQKNAKNYTNKRKTIYDKFAPVYYLRIMKKKSKEGNSKPGWYAGAKTIRKAAQGNPRLFLQIMTLLFERGRKSKLTPKVQHEIIFKFAESFCRSTESLENYGPIVHMKMEFISTKMMQETHQEELVSSGNVFRLKFDSIEDFERNKPWLELAIAYSRLDVDDLTKRNGLSVDTSYTLSNLYAIAYWIPIRSDKIFTINANQKEIIINNDNENERVKGKQLTLLGDFYVENC